jgi:DNA-binding CsgD family transcriptional regulator
VRAAESRLTATDQLLAAELLATARRAQADGVEFGAIDPAAARAEADRLVAELRRVTSGEEPTLPEAEARVLVGLAERGRLERGAGDPSLWATAATGWDALGRPYEAAYARWREGEAIARAHGSRDELARVLAAAHAAARGVGSLHLADAIERLARRTRVTLPGVAATTAAPFPDLTAREREVLALVANGRTNRQIAETLFITDKTASVHVSNILGKLGAANRGEAAALAHRAGFELEPSTYA